MTTERFQKREGYGPIMQFVTWVMRLVIKHATAKVAIWVGTVCAAGGALLSLLLMRTLALAQIAAQDVSHSARMTKIEVEAMVSDTVQNRALDSLRSRMGTVEVNTGTLIRAECLRTSKADQQLLQMACPSDLYRGVPR
jgi:hypothetical protein